MVDGPKNTLPVFALHLDADGVTKFHEFGGGLAIQNGLDGAFFSNAALAFGPFFFAVDFDTLVAHRAAAHD